MKKLVIGTLSLIINVLCVNAQIRPAGRGDACIGSGSFIIDEPMPEVPVGILYNDGRGNYGAGYIHPSDPLIVRTAITDKCPHRRKYIAKVSLKLEMTTYITQEGTAHPDTGKPRTSDGVKRSKEHETMHRTRFKNEFNKYKNRFMPIIAQQHDTFNAIETPLGVQRRYMESDWTRVKNEEGNHSTAEWDEWYEKKGFIW